MSYQFWLGPSGSGKSQQLHTWIIKRAEDALKRLDFSENYILVVPDQYTMQTQKEMVLEAGDRKGILNVDVLSFGRLSHRIFEELGADPRGVLDDMGKTLLLRRTAAKCGKELKVLHSGLERPGMIAEIKSVISEFMQYGISTEDVGELASCAAKSGQGSLAARLTDLQLLYQRFLEDRKERYITGEETLDLLAEAIPRSQLVAGSTIIFDGFTGFTPVQNRVLLALMQTAKKVVIALDYAEDGGTPLEEVMAGAPYEEQDLFYLTRKTVATISRMAGRAGIVHETDRYIGRTKEEKGHGRFAGNPALTHLESCLFRYPVKSYPEGTELPIHLMLASNPGEEVRQVFLQIRRLMEEKGYHYRDFAIVTGDLSCYGEEISIAAARYEIPVYLDMNRAILQNPLTETIRGGLEIGTGDYSYETVFRFLRSGLSGLTTEEIDRLENYCLKRGIASRKRWETAFDEEFEGMRQVILGKLRPLQDLGHATAKERTKALYTFLVELKAGEQLEALAAEFEAAGEFAAAMEYRQIYGAVVRLLDQLYELLGDEKVSAREFQELVEAGFAEIRLGTLPQQVDRILVGDIERTRLSEIKVLFFVGVNDGVIPASASKGGLLSDYDREFLQMTDFLQQSGAELAPTPRQEMYTQRLYLYMNLTKPTELLFLSYAKTAADGSSLRPSYLVGLLRQMFPGLEPELWEERPISQQLFARKDAAGILSGALRQYADGRFLQSQGQQNEFLTLYGVCLQAEECDPAVRARGGRHRIRQLRDAAFLRYSPVTLSQKTANLLYQGVIRGSVTRLETAAGCYLRHFLQYGLRLRERETYTFEASDSGTILHESVQRFGQLLETRGISWLEYTREMGENLVWEALQEMAGTYREQLLYSTQRGAYQLGRMRRILEQTVDALQFQLQQGDFYPAVLEQGFGWKGELQYELPDGQLILEGRIDRVDLAREDDQVYIKIVDYKSGSKDLDLKKVRAGLQLQLPLYMTAERKILQQKEGGKAVPAAMLYSRFDNPMLSTKEAEEILQELSVAGEKSALDKEVTLVRRSLRPTGYVSCEKDALQHLDHSLGAGGTSKVVPIRINKDGSISKSGSKSLSLEEWEELEGSVQETICRLSQDILSGRIDANPIRLNPQTSTCTYCPFQNSCGFDKRLPGYEYRDL